MVFLDKIPRNILYWAAGPIIAIILVGIYFGWFAIYFNSTTIDSIVIGVFTSALVVILTQLISKIRMWNNYKQLSGDWEEYDIEDRKLIKKCGEGEIRYINDNVLTIKLTHDEGKRTWRGQIVMNKDYIHTGSIVWHYEGEHEFGLKELLLPMEKNKKDNEYDYLYLISVPADKVPTDKGGYDKMVLRREKRKFCGLIFVLAVLLIVIQTISS